MGAGESGNEDETNTTPAGRTLVTTTAVAVTELRFETFRVMVRGVPRKFWLDGALKVTGLEPEGAAPEEGLSAAQSIISMLEMLQDKTEGRRTPDETGLLESLLYELRMAYVAKARVSGA